MRLIATTHNGRGHRQAALLATALWVVASAGFAVYTANFGKYNETYGSLGAVVVLMLWLYFTVLCVVVGAEFNAEIERQTRHDTTEGRAMPLGSRDAEVADTVGATAEELHSSEEAVSDDVRHGELSSEVEASIGAGGQVVGTSDEGDLLVEGPNSE